MELVFGIISLAISFFIVVILIAAKSEDIILSAALGMIFIIFLIVGVDLIDNYCYPSITPMDVYRGKTTLEITYKDSIAIDSTVVWKEEVK